MTSEDMADDGVRTGRLPVVDVGIPESAGGEGGVRSGVVSASGAREGVLALGTEGDAAQMQEQMVNLFL